MRALPLLLALMAQAMQDPEVPDRDPANDWRTVIHALDPPDRRGPDLEGRRRLLLEFLGRHGAQAPHLALLARSRLADLELAAGRTDAAEKLFDRIARTAPRDAIDLLGRAAYGRAQCLQLRGQGKRAREALVQVARQHAGTRYGSYARTALAALDAGSPPAPGDPLPAMPLGTEGTDRHVATGDLAGRPALLVFFSLDAPGSVAALEDLAATWAKGGRPPTDLVALGIGPAPALRAAARTAKWTFRVVPVEQGFLSRPALALGVHALPTALLIGPAGRLLVRDPSPDRLARLLQGKSP